MNLMETVAQEQKMKEQVKEIKREDYNNNKELQRFPDKIDPIHEDLYKYREN